MRIFFDFLMRVYFSST